MWKALVLVVLATFQDRTVDIPTLAADKDPSRRLQAIEAARTKDDPRLTPTLIPLLGDPHARIRLRARKVLTESGDPELLLRALRHPVPLVRQGACAALGQRKQASFLPALMEKLGDSDPRVRSEAASALGHGGDPKAADRLTVAFGKDSDPLVRTFALESLARLGSAAPLIEAAAHDRAVPVRMMACETCVGAGKPEVLETLIKDPEWEVRAAAVAACREWRQAPAVGWMVAQFPQEKGRLRWDFHQALTDLTGKDLSLDPAHWKSWWEASRESFVLPLAGSKDAAEIGGGTRAGFFKIPILSTRILFVLDLSGSMREPAPGGTTTKLEAAKQGMTETIRSLPSEARFGILGLGCDENGAYTLREKKTWQGRPCLIAASPPAKADAERFVRGLEARGWTNLYDGLEYAFTEPDVDTIYLYTDGGASKGTFIAASEILAQLEKMNRFRRIVVHAVEVPNEKNPEDNRRLLAQIAARTRGIARLHEKN